MRTKSTSKSLKTKKKSKPEEIQPRVRHADEHETDYRSSPEDEGRMANLTSVRHGSGYHRPADFSNSPEDDLAA